MLRAEAIADHELGLDKVEAVGHRDVSPNVRTAGYLRRA
jgi:hypothetical protein